MPPKQSKANYLSGLQGRYWAITLPQYAYTPYLHAKSCYVAGQLERGKAGNDDSLEEPSGGYLHWQLICYFNKKVRGSVLEEIFGQKAHIELSRSSAVEKYVWKDDTAIQGTRFELGRKPLKANSAVDHAKMITMAKEGKVGLILEEEPEYALRHYSTLRKIEVDFMKPVRQEKICKIFWGPTATGKSHRAWAEAGDEAYPKIPSTVTWDGYRADIHKNIIFEEFCGEIGICHILRWTDKYPVTVNVKYSGSVLKAQNMWFTSNIDPRDWYPNAPAAQIEALLRRFTIVHMDKKYVAPPPPPLVEVAKMNHDYWRDNGDNDEDFETAAKHLDEIQDFNPFECCCETTGQELCWEHCK